MEVSETKEPHATALESIPNNSDTRFPQFSKLPRELRQIIWKLACYVPRIHILKFPAEAQRIAIQPYNRSRANPILNTCREARHYILSLELNYFCPREYFNEKAPAITTSRRNHFTDELDTFWFEHDPNDDEDERVPQSIYEAASWHCGKCHRTQSLPTKCGNECFASKINIPLRRIAVNLADWVLTDQGMEDDIMDLCGSLGLAYLHNAQEIFIVVEKFGTFDHERDPIFLAPSEKDRRMTLETSRQGGTEEDIFSHAAREASWADSARFIENQLVQFKEDVIFEVNNPGFVPMEGQADYSYPADFPEWRIPTIRFVEARKGSDRRLLLS